MSNSAILAALQTAAIADIQTADNTLPIKSVGLNFEIPDNQRYVEFVHIPNDNDNAGWREQKIFAGLFRLVFFKGNDGQAPYGLINLAEQISAAFPKSRTLPAGDLQVRIVRKPSYSGISEMENKLMLSITLQYSAFAPET
jgi:hypothetical protein